MGCVCLCQCLMFGKILIKCKTRRVNPYGSLGDFCFVRNMNIMITKT